VHWCVHDARGYGVKADTLFCVLDCETPDHRVQAPLCNHRNRAVYAGDWLIGKRRSDAHNASRSPFQHLFHSELSDVEESQEVGRDKRIEILGSIVRKGFGTEDSGVKSPEHRWFRSV
jgi:hypothetical protein